jgi:protein TonB
MMKRNDVVGLTTSLVVHVLLLALFSLTTLGARDYEPIGYIEVDFGPLAEGRPVQQSVEEQVPDPADASEVVPEEEEPQPLSAPEEARPVDLPDEIETPAEDKVVTSDVETISPEEQANPEDTNDDEAKPEVIPALPRTGGVEDGATGSETGDDGAGSEAEASAPYQIEGLNRIPLTAPPPPYAEKVNAEIRVRITVDPMGKVTRQTLLLKGNPSLEQAVLETVRDWRFNPLPANAPQEPQTGIVTFRFRLE